MFRYKKDSDFLKVMREVKSFATLNHLNVVRYNQAWLEYAPSSENAAMDCPNNSSLLEKLSSEEESKNMSSGMLDIKTPFCESNESESTRVSRIKTTDEQDATTLSETPLLLLRVCLYIQMEYCDFDLRFWMDERAKGNPLPFLLSTHGIFKDIVTGVAHIHSKNVIHRDLKPQNIFYSSKSNSIKIGDFGLATLKDELDSESVLNCGTMPYAAPELRNNCKYDSKVDMYSLGVILIELVTETKTRMELSVVLERIFSGKAELHNTQYDTLMRNLVSSNPTTRFPADYVLGHLPLSDSSKGLLETEIKSLRETLLEKEKRLEELEALLRTYKNPIITS